MYESGVIARGADFLATPLTMELAMLLAAVAEAQSDFVKPVVKFKLMEA